MAANHFGKSFDCSAQVRDLRLEFRKCARIVVGGAVLFDHGAQSRVTVETRSAETGALGNGGERDPLSFSAQLSA
ncbi:MAG TPA: hypothetical protein VND89_00140 [Acidimicrobiales bacterium]|nr:hypothetical protein [Acidimicrobiales bacterium]